MKSFFIKIVSFVCAAIFLFEGIVLFSIRFGRIALNDILTFQIPFIDSITALNLLLGCSLIFLCFGFGFLHLGFRTTNKLEDIIIKENGEDVHIPVRTVSDFVSQILKLNSTLIDSEIMISNHSRWIEIVILFSYKGEKSVRQEVQQIKEILKGEIKRVFEFSYLKIDFQCEGVHVDLSTYDLDEEDEPSIQQNLDLSNEIQDVEDTEEVEQEPTLFENDIIEKHAEEMIHSFDKHKTESIINSEPESEIQPEPKTKTDVESESKALLDQVFVGPSLPSKKISIHENPKETLKILPWE